jgi:hypothetical protein
MIPSMDPWEPQSIYDGITGREHTPWYGEHTRVLEADEVEAVRALARNIEGKTVRSLYGYFVRGHAGKPQPIVWPQRLADRQTAASNGEKIIVVSPRDDH